MMLLFAEAKPLDMLDFWAVRAMLLLMAVLCFWLTIDTRRALKKMVRFTERWSPLGGRWLINPEKAGWIWFYRIDAAVVLIGIAQMFARHYLTR
jgi:hypothetical protein